MSTQESIGTEVEVLVGRAVTAIDSLGLAGRRLAVMGENCADTLVAHLGALSAGVSSAPVPRAQRTPTREMRSSSRTPDYLWNIAAPGTGALRPHLLPQDPLNRPVWSRLP